MLRIAICDDMNDFLLEAKSAINAWKNKPDSMIVDTFNEADSLIFAHSTHPYDIIFLDIVMPLLNGIDTAFELRQIDKKVKIVFLTTSVEYAIDAYSVKADNYLLKPIDLNKLHACLDDLYEDIQSQTKCLMIKTHNAIYRVPIRDIEYIEAQNKQVQFILSNHTSLLSIHPLYFYEDKLLLSDGFFKCHRSYIVNLYHIESYTPKEIKMHSGSHVPISRNNQKEFESTYFTLFFEKAGEW